MPLLEAISDRNFIFRVYSATVELEKCDFTKLPDYNRILMILENELDLTHNGGKAIHLNTFDQNAFDGKSNTTSVGRVTDFNLMMRKGKFEGKVEHKVVNGKTEIQIDKKYKTIIILAVDGTFAFRGG